jgi:hypothetical protein
MTSRDRPEIEITAPMVRAATDALLLHLDCYLPPNWGLAEAVATEVLRSALETAYAPAHSSSPRAR